jgi:hypothetical protein
MSFRRNFIVVYQPRVVSYKANLATLFTPMPNPSTTIRLQGEDTHGEHESAVDEVGAGSTGALSRGTRAGGRGSHGWADHGARSTGVARGHGRAGGHSHASGGSAGSGSGSRRGLLERVTSGRADASSSGDEL